MKKNMFLLLLFCIYVVSWSEPLTIVTDNWAPYEYTKKGEVTGFATEIVTAVLDNLGIEYKKPEIFPWSRGEFLVFNGKADVLYSGSIGEKRKENCFFPDESIISSDWVFFIRSEDKDRLKFDSFEDLKGKSIGVVQDYSYTSEFWEFIKKEKNYQSVAKEILNFKKLRGKRIDFVVAEYAVGLSMIKELGFQDNIIALKNNPIKSTGLYAMFSKKTVKPETVEKFSDELKKFKKSKQYRELYKKYF